ncbi:thioredoxin domain-containing protein [Sphingomonas sp. KR1UV-12]|uniref:Thioredoxin domain-containing protein n=1 Tax=Sphingomonas aurea TaxID=3063994 RepID=A0ABT9EK24_9SPHN|nr:thioredoxin domain-containing protein [Sphingomonas sp. KR1UV-12]MDP1027299.1 thioredoxin domain-containing protein [Sphingomonas sp. KR1UV-12]
MRLKFGLLALLLLAPTLTTAAPPRDWSAVATMKPDGAYVLGSPAAKVKLVEWASYTCPHCGHFATESAPVLKDRMIRSGSTSLEVRHLVRDPVDLAAAIVVRCTGARGFAATNLAVFAQQEKWMTQANTFLQANGERLDKLPRAAALRQVADGTGLTAIGKAHGLTEPQVAACFADQAAIDKLLALSATVPAEVTGTPTFFLNGKLQPQGTWAQLQPALAAAGAR